MLKDKQMFDDSEQRFGAEKICIILIILAESGINVGKKRISVFKAKSSWVYLRIIRDLYSRKIIGWRVSKYMSMHLVIATFKVTFPEWGNHRI